MGKRRAKLRPVYSAEAKKTRGRVWLRDLSDAYLTCHAQGHQYPRLRTLTGAEKGLVASSLGRGAWQLEFSCPSCGGSRLMTTSQGGILNLPVIYRYMMPKGYAAPPGAGLGRRDYMQESWRRFYHDNFESLDRIDKKGSA
jgi:hypothetical protein